MSTQNEIIWQENQYRVVRRASDNALLAEVRGYDALENEIWRKAGENQENVEALFRRATLWLHDRVKFLEVTRHATDGKLEDFARGCDEVDARKRETEAPKCPMCKPGRMRETTGVYGPILVCSACDSPGVERSSPGCSASRPRPPSRAGGRARRHRGRSGWG